MTITIHADTSAAADAAWRALLTADLPAEGAIFHAPGAAPIRVSRDAGGRLVLERLA